MQWGSFREIIRSNLLVTIDFCMFVHVFRKIDSPSCASWALRKSVMNCEIILSNAYRIILTWPTYQINARERGFNLIIIKIIDFLILLLIYVNKVYVEFKKTTKPFAGKRNFTQNKEIRFDRISSWTSMGILWDLKAEIFTFRQPESKYQNTKRGTFSFTASIFDPLGILTTFTFEPKLLTQEL